MSGPYLLAVLIFAALSGVGMWCLMRASANAETAAIALTPPTSTPEES